MGSHSRLQILNTPPSSHGGDSAFDSDSMMSMGSPPADSDGLRDKHSLTQPPRGYNFTGVGTAKPKRSDGRALIDGPRSDAGAGDVRMPRGFNRPYVGSFRPPDIERSSRYGERSGSVNGRYSGGYEMGYL